MGLFKKEKPAARLPLSEAEQDEVARSLISQAERGEYPSFKQIMMIKRLSPERRQTVDAALQSAGFSDGTEPSEDPSNGKLGR